MHGTLYRARPTSCSSKCRIGLVSLVLRCSSREADEPVALSRLSKKVSDVSRLSYYKFNTSLRSSSDTPRHYELFQRKQSGLYTGTTFTPNHSVCKSNYKIKGVMLGLQGVRMLSVQSTVESIVQTQAGWFQSLSESTIVSYAQNLLLSFHDLSGLPWWASIILTTVVVRTVITMPLALYQNYILAKVENLQLEMADIVKGLKIETAYALKKFGWTEKHARTIYNRSLGKQWKKLIVRDNCHPFKASILLWVQLPMWVCFSTAMRNLVYMLPQPTPAAQVVFLEMSVGGFGWIPNLTVPDSSFIIPVTFGLVNMAIIELQAMTRVTQSSKVQKIATNVFRVLTVVMIPVAASVPSCLSLYWTASSICGLGQNLLLLSPKIKRVTGIPKSASQLDQPYKHIADKIKERAFRLYKPLSTKY